MFKFGETPLGSDNYFSWPQDMEAVLTGKGLWKYTKVLVMRL